MKINKTVTRFGSLCLGLCAAALVVLAVVANRPEPAIIELEDDRLDAMSLPFFAATAVDRLMRQHILAQDDPAERRRRFELLRAQYGVGSARGVLWALNGMATGEAERALAELGPLEPDWRKAVGQHTLADGLAGVDPVDARFDDLAAQILTKLTERVPNVYDPIDRMIAEGNDYLALACMARLVGKGRDDLIRTYLDQRLDFAEHHGEGLRRIRDRLTPAHD